MPREEHLNVARLCKQLWINVRKLSAYGCLSYFKVSGYFTGFSVFRALSSSYRQGPSDNMLNDWCRCPVVIVCG